MTARQGIPSIEYYKRIDWKLLVFLVLFLNVKLVLKALALLIMFLWQKDLRFGFTLKNSRLPLFYPLALLMALINFIVYSGYAHTNTSLAFLTGCMGWIACILAIHQVKLITERQDAEVIAATLTIFFMLNALVSMANLGAIIMETGALNPYRYQGEYQKYFMGTGDYVRGISFDTSTTNAVLNAAGVIYFIYKRNTMMMLLCGGVLLLTASNLTNLYLWIILAGLFIFRSSREQKSLILILSGMLILFLVKVSPQNQHYLSEAWGKIAESRKEKGEISALNGTGSKARGEEKLELEKKRKAIALHYLDSLYRSRIINTQAAAPALLISMEHPSRPQLPIDDIHSPPFQNRDDTDAARRKLIHLMQEFQMHPQFSPAFPGKLIALQQTAHYFTSHPGQLFLGKGMGHFSSKLAFRTTALGIAGGYPRRYRYIDPDFMNNHLALYAGYFSQRARMHSITNLPNSVYDQLFSEYGLAGFTAFIIFYLGYFFRKRTQLSYGLPLLVLIGFICCSEYWLEQLSVIPFLELLLFLDLKAPIKNLPL